MFETVVSERRWIKFVAISKTKLRGLSLGTNSTDRATAVRQQSQCQLLQIEGATWSE
jgi:hypothetical protein